MSDIDWQAVNPYAVIADRLPWQDGLNDTQRHEIVQRLCDSGRLVLLLDAIDQTTTTQGLRLWLDRTKGKLSRCPVILTGRFSTESLPLFRGTKWETLRLDAFGRAEQEEFLGPEYSRTLLPQIRSRRRRAERMEEPEDDPATRRRKQHWLPLLGVPMLLKMMKQLAEADRLQDLTNREEVYRAATQLLIERGLDTLQDTDRQKLTRHETEQFLARLAWASIGAEHNFTGNVSGAAYTEACKSLDSSRSERKQLEESLDQINLFTRFSFVGARREDVIEWRHRSFLEYFAGMYLCDDRNADEQTRTIAAVHDNLAARGRVQAKQHRQGQGEQAESHIRPSDQWEWVHRFALSRSVAERRLDTLDHLAAQFIAHGNPYVVYESMTEDGIESELDSELASLARWLVHQTWDLRNNLRTSWLSSVPPQVGLLSLSLLRNLFDRRFRNVSVLPPAWQLLEECLPVKGDLAASDGEREAESMTGRPDLPPSRRPSRRGTHSNRATCPGRGDGGAHGSSPRTSTPGARGPIARRRTADLR